MEIGIIFLVVSVMALSIFNIIIAIKRNKKIHVVLNGALYGVIVLLVAFDIVNTSIISQDSENYSIYSGGILCSMEYDRTESGYHIIKQRGILTSTDIAIPIEDADISFFTKIYNPVHIYCDKGTDLYVSQIIINSENYAFCDTAAQITPDFFDLILIVSLADFLVIAAFNPVLFIINIENLYKEKSEC